MMHGEAKRILRERIQEDIDEVTKRIERNIRLIDDIRWGTSEKRAREIRRDLLDGEVELGNLLYELRDCIRDDERRE